jgi:hypothetical protein
MPGGDADCSRDAAPATLPPPLRHADGRPAPPPREAPEFTIGDLRAAVPARCFKRSAVTGGLCARVQARVLTGACVRGSGCGRGRGCGRV